MSTIDNARPCLGAEYCKAFRRAFPARPVRAFDVFPNL